VLQNIEQGREIFLEQANVALFSGIVINEEPSNFDEAGNHAELCDMDKQQVWEIIKKEDIPEIRRTIKCKWIFKIKKN
jgi:hypothetical protein